MPSDPDGRVLFPAVWWRAIVLFAARVLDLPVELVAEIEWDPIVDGQPQRYRRHYAKNRYMLHEAFLPGDVIGINAVLPDGMSLDMFWQLLSTAGTYKGISPFRPKERYGTFEVLGVRPRRTGTESNS